MRCGVSPMDVKAYRPSDYSSVLKLEGQCFEQHSALQYMELYLSSPKHFFVACDNGIVVGYVSGRAEGNVGRLISVGVDPEYRRMGIGAALVKRFIESIPSSLTWLALEVRAGNVAAQRLYVKFGFRICQRLPKYYLNGEDGLLMLRPR